MSRRRLASALPANTAARFTLRDVLLALAREHGFPGWTQLKSAVEQRSAEAADADGRSLALYEAKADALLEAYRTGAPDAMERHYRFTWHRRPWRGMGTAAGVVLAATVIACLAPARRAAHAVLRTDS